MLAGVRASGKSCVKRIAYFSSISTVQLSEGQNLSTIAMDDSNPTDMKTEGLASQTLTSALRLPNGTFQNPWDTHEERSLIDVMRWKMRKRTDGMNPDKEWLMKNQHPKPADFAAAFPLNPVDYTALANPPASEVQALWVGHATLLVQLEGLTFLTDPHLSDRASPVQFAGPKRVVAPALDVEHASLPRIDFVVISHNHYDHLDVKSVERLRSRFGDALRWYVPLGLAAWFKGVGITNVVELDWWEEAEFPGSSVTVAFTPAQHWSTRGVLTRNTSLWGSWAVKGEKRSFWFGGDSGYCSVFKEIGEKYGPFDLAAIPVGAYEPRWFMKPQHVNPAEAVQMHKDVKARKSVGIHCCTFSLTDEALDEPPAVLVQEAAEAGLKPDDFIVLQHGAILRTSGGSHTNLPPLLGPR